MAGARSTHGRYEKCIQNFGRRSEGKGPLTRRSHRWEDNIKLDLRE